MIRILALLAFGATVYGASLFSRRVEQTARVQALAPAWRLAIAFVALMAPCLVFLAVYHAIFGTFALPAWP
jgi:hypothetical protein